MKLRPYQKDAVAAVVNEFRKVNSTLIVMATGLGKTVVFTHLLDLATKGRVLVVAHREELVDQAAKKIKIITGEYPAIEMADRASNETAFGKSKVVVASVQTLISGMGGKGRMTKFEPTDFSLVIFDEAHHVEASSWQKVLSWFKGNKDLRILGCTATPNRHDKKALGRTFESVAYNFDLSQAVPQGWCVPVKQNVIEIEDLDYDVIRTTAGDLNAKDLAKVMEKENHLHAIAGPALKIGKDKKTLIFAASVMCAERLTEIINRHEDCARFVTGKTPKVERREIIEGFAKGEFSILVNVGVLLEGYDEPGVEVIIMAAPTKSVSKWIQMVGRGTRPLPGVVDDPNLNDSPDERRDAIAQSQKPHLEIIDLAGNSTRHCLIQSFDILGGRYPDDVIERAKKNAINKGLVDPEEELQRAQEEIEEEEEQERLDEAAHRARLKATVKFNSRSVDPFTALDLGPPRDPGKLEKEPTVKMLEMLAKNGVDGSDMGFGDARKLILQIIDRRKRGLCSLKQAMLLKKFDYDAKNLTRDDASAIIDALASNGWKK
jgi:superfamily II DNA or RNA helicase